MKISQCGGSVWSDNSVTPPISIKLGTECYSAKFDLGLKWDSKVAVSPSIIPSVNNM